MLNIFFLIFFARNSFFCPIGFARSMNTKTKRAECKMCNAGSRSHDFKCKECEIGKYQPEKGTGFCLPCIPGLYNTVRGQLMCQDCNIGFHAPKKERSTPCIVCPIGFISSLGSSRCEKCGVGKASSVNGDKCELCNTGYYKNGRETETSDTILIGTDTTGSSSTTMSTTSSQCKLCELGKTTTAKGLSNCELCDVGRFAAEAGYCIECPSGWYIDTIGSTQCIECKYGENYINAFTKCHKCQLGTYGSKPGLCSDCEAGRYMDAKGGEKRCLACPVNTYTTEEGKTSVADCTACVEYAKHTTTDQKKGISNPIGGCVCAASDSTSKAPKGFYTTSKVGAAATICSPCPSGAGCTRSGMFLTDLSAQPGYWRPTSNSNIFSACSLGQRGMEAEEIAKERCCPNNNINVSICAIDNNVSNGTRTQCLTGYTGVLCKVCADNYVLMANSCVL